MARTHPWQVSDALWERVEPLVPPSPSRARGGRPRLPDRQVFAAIVYVLRTGIQWNALPRDLGSSSTVHARFQAWVRAGCFAALWEAEVADDDELTGIDWAWQAVDEVMTKAPFGGAASGPNPTDRTKQGTKRSLLTDGAGIPLAVAIDGANRHAMKRHGRDPRRHRGGAAGAERRGPAAPLSGCRLRRRSGAGRGRDPGLHGPHPRPGRGTRGQTARARLAGAALGGGADPCVDQPLPPPVGALGEEGRELPRLRPARLRAPHLLQTPGFRISSKYWGAQG